MKDSYGRVSKRSFLLIHNCKYFKFFLIKKDFSLKMEKIKKRAIINGAFIGIPREKSFEIALNSLKSIAFEIGS